MHNFVSSTARSFVMRAFTKGCLHLNPPNLLYHAIVETDPPHRLLVHGFRSSFAQIVVKHSRIFFMHATSKNRVNLVSSCPHCSNHHAIVKKMDLLIKFHCKILGAFCTNLSQVKHGAFLCTHPQIILHMNSSSLIYHAIVKNRPPHQVRLHDFRGEFCINLSSAGAVAEKLYC